ncbi:hypothetical protein B0A79_01965 [Flavobacterium piscis]|uniref:Uncharacterized protein n=1 Tax=Flavobacterium piscis TaxID=1114874 RepID=A0ABX2XSW1_9FLAO|nr:hypothetical protein [Flavobacterium piscis]OCB77156.1 hypothetical protein FLP_04230 [Flavobacterium piscis]OXG07797.1 hypothetical protein B0A79_01965 [Flavobacterium piscis]
MTNIQIIKIGHNDHLDFSKLKKRFDSSLTFKSTNDIIITSPTFLNEDNLTITDNKLATINIANDADFSVGIIDRPLQGNYFTRPIKNNFIVISTFGLEELNLREGITAENYLLRFIYAFTIMFNAYGGLNHQAGEIMQNNITGCLFDKAIYKKQISTFFKNPHISLSAENILNTKAIHAKLISNTKKDIKKLKISWYYNYSNWLGRNPVWATIIIFISGLLLSELGGNFLYDWITKK